MDKETRIANLKRMADKYRESGNDRAAIRCEVQIEQIKKELK